MADNFRLLFKSVALERPTGLDLITVTAEGMPHQRQIEAAALLGLPDVRQLVDEETLPVKGFFCEILRPKVRMRMEVNMAHRRHRNASRLKGPPFAMDHAHSRIVDRVTEDRFRHRDLAGCQGP